MNKKKEEELSLKGYFLNACIEHRLNLIVLNKENESDMEVLSFLANFKRQDFVYQSFADYLQKCGNAADKTCFFTMKIYIPTEGCFAKGEIYILADAFSDALDSLCFGNTEKAVKWRKKIDNKVLFIPEFLFTALCSQFCHSRMSKFFPNLVYVWMLPHGSPTAKLPINYQTVLQSASKLLPICTMAKNLQNPEENEEQTDLLAYTALFYSLVKCAVIPRQANEAIAAVSDMFGRQQDFLLSSLYSYQDICNNSLSKIQNMNGSYFETLLNLSKMVGFKNIFKEINSLYVYLITEVFKSDTSDKNNNSNNNNEDNSSEALIREKHGEILALVKQLRFGDRAIPRFDALISRANQLRSSFWNSFECMSTSYQIAPADLRALFDVSHLTPSTAATPAAAPNVASRFFAAFVALQKMLIEREGGNACDGFELQMQHGVMIYWPLWLFSLVKHFTNPLLMFVDEIHRERGHKYYVFPTVISTLANEKLSVVLRHALLYGIMLLFLCDPITAVLLFEHYVVSSIGRSKNNAQKEEAALTDNIYKFLPQTIAALFGAPDVSSKKAKLVDIKTIDPKADAYQLAKTCLIILGGSGVKCKQEARNTIGYLVNLQPTAYEQWKKDKLKEIAETSEEYTSNYDIWPKTLFITSKSRFDNNDKITVEKDSGTADSERYPKPTVEECSVGSIISSFDVQGLSQNFIDASGSSGKKQVITSCMRIADAIYSTESVLLESGKFVKKNNSVLAAPVDTVTTRKDKLGCSPNSFKILCSALCLLECEYFGYDVKAATEFYKKHIETDIELFKEKEKEKGSNTTVKTQTGLPNTSFPLVKFFNSGLKSSTASSDQVIIIPHVANSTFQNVDLDLQMLMEEAPITEEMLKKIEAYEQSCRKKSGVSAAAATPIRKPVASNNVGRSAIQNPHEPVTVHTNNAFYDDDDNDEGGDVDNLNCEDLGDDDYDLLNQNNSNNL